MTPLVKQVRAALADATPGPWKFDGYERLRSKQGLQDGSADIAHFYHSNTQCENAHLIANSPTWLAELCDRVERLEHVMKIIADSGDGSSHGDNIYRAQAVLGYEEDSDNG